MFQYGSTTYGLYSVKEDPTAVPHDENRAEYMTGVEVYRGEKLLFRGGVWNADGSYWLYKGTWYAWCGAVCVSILNVLSILFADELFR